MVTVINVGAVTEMKEKKAWPSSATGRALDKLEFENPDEQRGVEIVKKALEEPAKWIIQNPGLEGADGLGLASSPLAMGYP